jgi:ribosomal protein L40E
MLVWSGRGTRRSAETVCGLPQNEVWSRRRNNVKATKCRTGRCKTSKDSILRPEDDKRQNSSLDRDREQNIVDI